jgi:hypothetical protein
LYSIVLASLEFYTESGIARVSLTLRGNEMLLRQAPATHWLLRSRPWSIPSLRNGIDQIRAALADIGVIVYVGCNVVHKKEVKISMEKQNTSMTVKAGSSTYFFDLKDTKDGKLYLVITQSRYMGERKERERSSIIVFPEHALEFLETLRSLTNQLI